MKEVAKSRFRFLKIAIVLLLFFIPFLWIKNNNIASSEEANIVFLPQISFVKSIHTWNHSYGFGTPNYAMTLIPYTGIVYFMSLFFELNIIYKIVYGLILSMSYISATFFLETLLNSKSKKIFLASVLYVGNPFFIYTFLWFPSYGFLFILTPVVMAIVLRYLRTNSKELSIQNFCYLVPFFLISGPIFQNLGLGGIFLISIGLVSIFEVLYGGKGLVKMFKVFTVYILFLLCNLYWILPYTRMIVELYGHTKIYEDILQKSDLITYSISKGLYLSQYYWLDKVDPNGKMYYAFNAWYGGITKVLLPTIIIFLTIGLIKIKKNRNELVLAFLLIILGIFLGKGPDGLFGWFYRNAILNLQIFGIFRAGDIKFPYLTLLGILIGTTITLLYLLKNRKSICIATVLIAILVSPIMIGSPIASSEKINLPNYWIEYAEKENNSHDSGRILLLPENSTPFDSFLWGYEGGWLTSNLLLKSSIGNTNGYGGSAQETNFFIAKKMYVGMSDINFLEIIKPFNVDQILIRNDMINGDEVKNLIDSKIPKYESFGPNLVYRIEQKNTLGYVDGDGVSYSRVTPELYAINIKSKAEIVEVSLQESYSLNWILRSSKKKLLEECISRVNHERSVECQNSRIKLTSVGSKLTENNDHGISWNYGNKYLINLAELCKTDETNCAKNGEFYSIDLFLEYSPQRLFIIGFIITSFTAIGCLLSLLFRKIYI